MTRATFRSVQKKIALALALLFSATMLTACGGTDTEVSDWWYNQRWEGGSSE